MEYLVDEAIINDRTTQLLEQLTQGLDFINTNCHTEISNLKLASTFPQQHKQKQRKMKCKRKKSEHGESSARVRMSSKVEECFFLFLGDWKSKQLVNVKTKASTIPMNGMNTAHSVSLNVKLDL